MMCLSLKFCLWFSSPNGLLVNFNFLQDTMELESSDLEFLKNDPGAVKHGNFINYYGFNSVQSRIDHLDYKMFPKPNTDTILVLDVGCNTGDLTVTLHHYLARRYEDCNIEILAIDIDPKLIASACETASSFIEYKTANIMDDEGRNIIQKYLEKHKRQCFDLTFCFSVTMWIHLNNGDEGLLDFLKYIQSISTTCIIEPQIWKCYRSAQRRLKRAGSSFEKYFLLKIRKNVVSVIESTMLEGNFSKTFESTLTAWDRKIQCYCSNDVILLL